jgi:hypothetical protein
MALAKSARSRLFLKPGATMELETLKTSGIRHGKWGFGISMIYDV